MGLLLFGGICTVGTSGTNSARLYYGAGNSSPIEVAQQSEVSSLKASVSEGKSLIASAITDKGVSTSSTATFQTMADNIHSIISGIPITDFETVRAVNIGNSYTYPNNTKYIIVLDIDNGSVGNIVTFSIISTELRYGITYRRYLNPQNYKPEIEIYKLERLTDDTDRIIVASTYLKFTYSIRKIESTYNINSPISILILY